MSKKNPLAFKQAEDFITQISINAGTYASCISAESVFSDDDVKALSETIENPLHSLNTTVKTDDELNKIIGQDLKTLNNFHQEILSAMDKHQESKIAEGVVKLYHKAQDIDNYLLDLNIDPTDLD